MENKKNVSFHHKLQGYVEEILSKGAIGIIGVLAGIMTFVIVFFAVILVLTNLKSTAEGESLNFLEAMWQNFLRVIDSGTISGDELWGYRIISLIITFVGILIFGALIGVLTTGLDNLFVEMRKGKTEILKDNHTLILGWNPTIFKIISELVVSNSNHKNKSIVILSDRDKIEMEDEIRQKINQKEILKSLNSKGKKLYETKIYCRSGNTIDLDDLKIVHPENADSVIILSPEGENGDIDVIKTILALRKKAKKIVTEIRDEQNKDIMDFCFQDKEDENIIYIPTEKWLSRITAQASRQPGFSSIISEILNYDKNELYFSEVPKEIVGKTFKEVALNCVSSIVLGIQKKNVDINSLRDEYKKEYSDGKLLSLKKNIFLNPYEKFSNNIVNGENIGCIIEEGDQLILLQDDDGVPTFNFEKISVENYKSVDGNPLNDELLPKSKILILGYNSKIYRVVKELFGYVSDESEVNIIAKVNEQIENELKSVYGQNSIINAEITNIDTYEDENGKMKIDLDSYESIIILGDEELEIQEKDAKSILTMLLIKRLFEKNGKSELKDKNVVIEVYDEKNREIVDLTEITDYIISDTIISSVITQLSEENRLYNILDEILGSAGCEIYLDSIQNYIDNFEREYTFKELSSIVANEGTILMGYKKSNEEYNKNRNYGVYLNPEKNNKIKLSKDDKVIILFEGAS